MRLRGCNLCEDPSLSVHCGLCSASALAGRSSLLGPRSFALHYTFRHNTALCDVRCVRGVRVSLVLKKIGIRFLFWGPARAACGRREKRRVRL